MSGSNLVTACEGQAMKLSQRLQEAAKEIDSASEPHGIFVALAWNYKDCEFIDEYVAMGDNEVFTCNKHRVIFLLMLYHIAKGKK